MPTNRTRRSRGRQELTDMKLGELHEGPGTCLLAGGGYFMHPTFPGCVRGPEVAFYWELSPDHQATIIEAMRADWQVHNERVLALWTGDGEPWALREFGPVGGG